MIKLIASDLDGTLLKNGAQSLEPRTIDVIKRLIEKGIIFVASSGRQYANLRRLFAPICEDIAYICENGCLSFFEDRKIHKETMERELGEEILHAIWEKDTAEILLSGERTSYLQPKKESYLIHIRDVVKNNVTCVDDIFSVEEEYFKISVYEENGIGDSAYYWHQRFDKKATVVTSGNVWLDFMPTGVDKGLAMGKLQRYLGIAPEECMAFGDNYNDLEMLASVKYNFVMNTAPEEIRSTTHYVTSQVEDVLECLLADGEDGLQRIKK